MTNFEAMVEKLGTMTPAERDHLGRLARGEDADDLIRRGDVYEALRDLRTDPIEGPEQVDREFRRGLQRGLGQALGAVSALSRAENYCISGPGTLDLAGRGSMEGETA